MTLSDAEVAAVDIYALSVNPRARSLSIEQLAAAVNGLPSVACLDEDRLDEVWTIRQGMNSNKSYRNALIQMKLSTNNLRIAKAAEEHAAHELALQKNSMMEHSGTL